MEAPLVERIAALLRIERDVIVDAQWADNGPGWAAIILRSAREVPAPYLALQGSALGREGRVHVSQDGDGTIWMGGGTVTCVTGEVDL